MNETPQCERLGCDQDADVEIKVGDRRHFFCGKHSDDLTEQMDSAGIGYELKELNQ